MQDNLTLIEKIQQNQAEMAKDLELLKAKEDERYTADIESLQEQQQEFAAEIEELQRQIQSGKGGAK